MSQLSKLLELTYSLYMWDVIETTLDCDTYTKLLFHPNLKSDHMIQPERLVRMAQTNPAAIPFDAFIVAISRDQCFSTFTVVRTLVEVDYVPFLEFILHDGPRRRALDS
jgi:hypothetical protein